MHYEYSPRGVCSSKIEFDLNDGKMSHLKFTGGCNGNLKAIGILTEGMEAKEIIRKLRGNSCGGKQTSCADQLSKALEEAEAEAEKQQ
jgi:uncharacterized protein (TIGR03905 family)